MTKSESILAKHKQENC